MGSAASTAYKLGQETSSSASVGAGISGMARAAKGAASNRLKSASGLGAAAERGRQAAWAAGSTSTGSAAGASDAASSESTPAWAQTLHASPASLHRRQTGNAPGRDSMLTHAKI